MYFTYLYVEIYLFTKTKDKFNTIFVYISKFYVEKKLDYRMVLQFN